MLKVIFPDNFQLCLRIGFTSNQVQNLVEEYEKEFGKKPKSFGEVLEVLE